MHVPPNLLLQWHVTDQCNLKCAHCYQQDQPSRQSTESEMDLVLGQYRRMLANWRALANRKVGGHVTITGGEPLMDDRYFDFFQTLARLKDEFSFAILSNAVAVEEKTASFLASIQPAFVQVSIDGNRQTHDAMRGQGAYEKAVEGAALLAKAGVPVLLGFTAHRGNYREFPEVARLARRIGADYAWADRMVPAGRGESMADQVLDPAETRRFFEIMLKARGRWPWSRKRVRMRRALQFLTAGGIPYRCPAGDSLITVMPDGEVYPCRRMPIPVGNVFEEELPDVYQNHPLLRKLREPGATAAGCEGCPFDKACGGGLRCLSHALTGDPLSRDPGCFASKDH